MSRSHLVDVALQLQPRHDLLERPALRQVVVSRLAVTGAAPRREPLCPTTKLLQRFLGSAVVREEIHATTRRNLDRGGGRGCGGRERERQKGKVG